MTEHERPRTPKQEVRVVQESTRRLLAEHAARARWRGRNACAEPFHPIDEIQEAGQRAGWTVIVLDENAR